MQPGLRAVNLQKARMLDRLSNANPDLAQQIRALKLNWFAIRNLAEEDTEVPTAEVFIYDEIGGSFGVDVRDFIDELNAVNADEIVVRINSPGGLLIDGIAISSAISQHPAHITTRVDGIAASAASIVALAGDRIEMMDGSQMMIHDVMCVCSGNAKDMREAAAWLEEQSNNVAQIYANKAGGDLEEWRARMLAETWMFAGEAVELGLADGIYQRVQRSLPGQELPEEEPEPEDPEEENPDEDEEEESVDEALNNLMNRRHRMTNRGFKYSGRNKAPAPLPHSEEDQLDKFIGAFSKVLGGKK
jgi:ATP-dependent protease ClpP protease subunit